MNVAIGGAKSSQHQKGEAIDIDCDQFGNGNNKGIFEYIRKNLVHDQIINEFPDENGNPSWVHVSVIDEKKAGRKNRMEALIAKKNSDGDTIYYNA